FFSVFQAPIPSPTEPDSQPSEAEKLATTKLPPLTPSQMPETQAAAPPADTDFDLIDISKKDLLEQQNVERDIDLALNNLSPVEPAPTVSAPSAGSETAETSARSKAVGERPAQQQLDKPPSLSRNRLFESEKESESPSDLFSDLADELTLAA